MFFNRELKYEKSNGGGRSFNLRRQSPPGIWTQWPAVSGTQVAVGYMAFSKVIGVLLHKVATNTELVNMGQMLSGRHRVRVLRASGHMLISQSIKILFHVCFFFKTSFLMHMVVSLTVNSWPIAHSCASLKKLI